MNYLEPARNVTYKENIKRSIFIASVELCHDESEARDFLSRVASQHKNATHNCRAYIIGDTEYSSDDGEPSGTAGKPILNAIKHNQLVNVMVIVTRYFGGVKLGVRGLIDAYGQTAAKALELAGSVERVKTCKLRVALGYAAMGTVTHLLETCGALVLRWEYGESVSVIADLPEEFGGYISRELEELAARNIIAEWEMMS